MTERVTVVFLIIAGLCAIAIAAAPYVTGAYL